MNYAARDMTLAALAPANAAAAAACRILAPWGAALPPLRAAAAGLEMFERATRAYPKPAFGIAETKSSGRSSPVVEEIVAQTSFCRLLQFKKPHLAPGPKLLLVAPLSGHHATLLRGTVEALLPDFDVHITDWEDARDVPLSEGFLTLDGFVETLVGFLQKLGPRTHAVAVCQPAPALIAAAALMDQSDDPARPASLTLMGGPVDPAAAPTEVTRYAMGRPIEWFDSHVIDLVPARFPGAFRRVYPGSLQLAGFMALDPHRHVQSHVELFQSLAFGDDADAAAIERFYDEYFSVIDLDARFYLETVERVYQRRDLPLGRFSVNGRRVQPGRITDIPLLTVEGAKDDIAAPGQCAAAHEILSGLPDPLRGAHVQAGVGHYGLFAGRKFRADILPRLRAFLRAAEDRTA